MTERNHFLFSQGKQNFKVASRINKGRKEIIFYFYKENKISKLLQGSTKDGRKSFFEPGDWVWIHFRKVRFSSQRKTKLHPRGDDRYQVLERINNNSQVLE